MPTLRTACFGAALLATACHADVYMHNPRGSNDRNCERNVNRNNGNRMFDSQNNAKGGYACPRQVGASDNNLFPTPKQMYYYEGSYVPIEWTNQHGCGQNGKLNCEIIIQYACEAQLDPNQELRSADGAYVGAPRDGVPRDSNDAATDTINLNGNQIAATNTENRRYGVHETLDFYEDCSRRERNKGLFTADQNVNRRDATGTRQNPNGNRRGLECPEERDYYPYWAPSPWVDVAVLSSNAGMGEDGAEWESDFCKYAMTNSQNVKPVGYCAYPAEGEWTQAQQNAYNQREWPNNERACDDINAEWELTTPKTGVPPDCLVGAFTRVNHLGNPVNEAGYGQKSAAYRDNIEPEFKAALEAMPETGSASQYLWKVPEVPDGQEQLYENCVLRLRYNTSTADYPAYAVDEDSGSLTATVTDEDLPGTAPASFTNEWKVYDIPPGLDSRFNNNDSPIQQDSYVELGDDDDEFVSLAVNTNQYGRVFQDRSYNFAIKKRPANIAASQNIFNVNVRGKRGNIVQVYPAVEYDFVPSGLSLSTANDDMVHWQWTGSDYNPQRGCNDAEGGPPDGNNGNQNARADRTNIVELANMAHNYPFGGLENQEASAPLPLLKLINSGQAGADEASEYTFFTDSNGDADADMIKKMAFLNMKEELAAKGETCLTQDQLNNINNQNQRDTNPRNCAKVNTEHPYFDGGLQTVTARSGTYGFFSSRNNNFSNRDQTMGICVDQATCTFTAPMESMANFVEGDRAEPDESNLIEGDLIENDPVDNDGFGDGFKFGCTQTEDSSKPSDTEIVGIVFGSLLGGAAVAFIAMQVYKGRAGTSAAGKSTEMPKYTSGSRGSAKAKSSNWMTTSEVL